MASPFDDALRSLQTPQQQAAPDAGMAAKNAAIINQYNHSNAHERARRNAQRITPPNHDALMQKLGTIDALLMQGQMVDQSRFKPETLKLAETAQMTGKPNLAYQILNEENRKLLSRDAIGGAPLSTMAWEKLRDHAGHQAINRHSSDLSGDQSSPYGQSDAKDQLYRIGVDSFDKTFGKHKRYLVEDNLSPTGMAPGVTNQSPRLSPPRAPAVEGAPMPQNNPPMAFTGNPRMPLPMTGTPTVGDENQ